MPVEVRELIIKTRINADAVASGSEVSDEKMEELRQSIIWDTKRQLRKDIQRSKDR